MPRPTLAALVVVVLVLLAGCESPSAGPTPGEGDGTTATAGSADGPDLPPGAYPDGYSENGIETEAARDRTLAVLREEPVVIDAREVFRPGAYADYHYEANASHARFRMDVHNGQADVNDRDVFVGPERRYTRRNRNGRIAVETSNGTVAATRQRAGASLWAVVSRILVLGEFEAVRVSGEGDDRRIRYVLADTIVENATTERGSLVIDGDGVIREANLAYSIDGERKRFEYVLGQRSDVTVAVPGWVERVGEDTRGTRASVGR